MIGPVHRVVYVDSASTDKSVALARLHGAEVVELDMSTTFSAARARNAGFQRLVEADPGLRFVQFIDGDCEILDGWLRVAVESLETRPELAIVAGWVRERAPEASIYNRLGNIEWNFAGVGEVESVGGIFMIRREAFEDAGGFDPTIAAGEEPEFCQRLSRRGWRIRRLDERMALHDLAMTRFGQWWKRQVRFGYGSMDVATRFKWPRFQRNNLTARFWSAWLLGVLTAGPLAAGFPRHGVLLFLALMLLILWPSQLGRIALRTWRAGQPFALSVAYAFFLMVSFWPQMLGQLLYWNDRARKQNFRLIEHKDARGSGSG